MIKNLDDMLAHMRDWRTRDVPDPSPVKLRTPAFARMQIASLEDLEKYVRFRALRDAGYEGPLDVDCRIPDPDDPEVRRNVATQVALR